MIDVTKIYYFVFGALTIVGGVMGYVKAKSAASLIAGGLCGVYLLNSAGDRTGGRHPESAAE